VSGLGFDGFRRTRPCNDGCLLSAMLNRCGKVRALADRAWESLGSPISDHLGPGLSRREAAPGSARRERRQIASRQAVAGRLTAVWREGPARIEIRVAHDDESPFLRRGSAGVTANGESEAVHPQLSPAERIGCARCRSAEGVGRRRRCGSLRTRSEPAPSAPDAGDGWCPTDRPARAAPGTGGPGAALGMWSSLAASSKKRAKSQL
jgi:hypothetical protein